MKSILGADVQSVGTRARTAEYETRMGLGWTTMRMRGEGVGEGDTERKGGRDETMDHDGLMGYWVLKGCVGRGCMC